VILIRLITQTFFLAVGQIWANKVRSMLTTLGIIIGVAAVVATVAATNGLRQWVLDEFATFGAKKVFIDGTLPQSQWSSGRWREVQLKLEEVDAIMAHCPSLKRINPHWYGNYDIVAGDRTLQSVQVVGIWPQWHDIEARYVIGSTGRPFSALDDQEAKRVCLINEKAIEELDLDRDPVGDYIAIKGQRFLVIGVVETKSMSAMFGGGDTQTEVYIPFNTARILNPLGWLNYAVAELESPDKAEDAVAEITFVLRSTRHLEGGDENTFDIEVLQQIIDQFNSMARGITAGAGGIVAISLLVGGIGIMNIMLVSVSERTREIGLRKAMGARPAVVLVQFLVEAVVLCLAGAAVGLAIGQGLMILLTLIPDSPIKRAEVPAWAVILAVGFSAFTGIVFGMFPAIKAARLDPIEALRHE
jgi:putative ABC transport system permease protein